MPLVATYLIIRFSAALTDDDVDDIEEAGAKGARRRFNMENLGRRLLFIIACVTVNVGLSWWRA